MKKNFYEKVFAVARKIPYGKVTSYGAIAKFVGSPQSARMVGWAMNKSELHVPPIPAHRVVNRNGLLTGKNHFANENTMVELLQSEGIEIIDSKVVDFNECFWLPE